MANEKWNNFKTSLKTKTINEIEENINDLEENPFKEARDGLSKLKMIFDVLLTLVLFVSSSISAYNRIKSDGLTLPSIFLIAANSLYLIIIFIHWSSYKTKINNNYDAYKHKLRILRTKLFMKIFKLAIAVILFFNLVEGYNLFKLLTIVFAGITVLSSLLGVFKILKKIKKVKQNKEKILNKSSKKENMYNKLDSFYERARSKKLAQQSEEETSNE